MDNVTDAKKKELQENIMKYIEYCISSFQKLGGFQKFHSKQSIEETTQIVDGIAKPTGLVKEERARI